MKTLCPAGIVFPHNFLLFQFPLMLIFKNYKTLSVLIYSYIKILEIV